MWALFLVPFFTLAVRAQIPAPPDTPPPSIVTRIGIDQKLGNQVPLELTFRDESGQSVKLSQYFGRKPVVLALVYYECPMLCTRELNAMLGAFKLMNLDIGRDFEVVTISFDPSETPQLAAAKKSSYTAEYGRPGAAAGWHFLTGNEPSIRAVTSACGFRYFYQPRIKQYAHAAGIMVLTPQGQLSRYFYGIEYSPRDLRWGLIEASGNKIGSLVDQALLLCYHYDPASGRYGLMVMRSLRIGGVLILLAVGTFVARSLWKERRAQNGAHSLRPQ